MPCLLGEATEAVQSDIVSRPEIVSRCGGGRICPRFHAVPKSAAATTRQTAVITTELQRRLPGLAMWMKPKITEVMSSALQVPNQSSSSRSAIPRKSTSSVHDA